MIERREIKNKELEDNLRKEEKKEKNKILGKKIIKIVIAIIIFSILLVMYMHYIGTSGLEVKEDKVVSNKLPTELHGMKLVQFSDLNYGSTIEEKDIKKLVNTINKINPDIVVFTGDLIAKNKKLSDNDIAFLTKQLKKIKANVGIYAIKGDKDYNKNYDKIINETKFKILDNTYELIYYKGSIPILITGCGSLLKNDCNLGQAFSYNEMDNLYTISLIHETATVKTINDRYKPDLILAGHNLNGQIRLPIIGGIKKTSEGGKYLNPKYKLSNSLLYVSGGLGTEDSEFRLFNRPSINFLRLVKGK